MIISIVIPTYNEESTIGRTVEAVHNACRYHHMFNVGNALGLPVDGPKQESLEILVVDGGSSDDTQGCAEAAGAKVLESPSKGRAAQMNYGADHARGEVLYFLHADTHPPPDFDAAIRQSVGEGNVAGCFQLTFDDNHRLLRLYAWFTRFDIDAFRFGDQSLFVTRSVFRHLQGFREDHLVMEDQEIVQRIRKYGTFQVLPDMATTSARKYREHGVIKLQLIYLAVFSLYYLGVEQEKLGKLYSRLLK